MTQHLLISQRWDKEIFLKQLPVAACMISRQGVVEYANEVYAALMGSTIDNMVGQALQVFSEEAARNVQNDFVTFDRGGAVPDHELYVKDSIYWVTVRPVMDDQGVAQALVACLSNISNLKSFENKVQKVSEEIIEAENFCNDGLTHLKNKADFYVTLEKQLQKMFNKRRPLSLILLEVDEFATYLQHEGQEASNQILCQITELIQQVGGEGLKLIYRYDQDKLSIILPNTQLKEAAILAEQIRQKIYTAVIPNAYSDYQRMTVSMGVYTEHSVISYMRIINGADNALYLARKNGKNRIEIY
jgi:diguanylate cyclase (GGDEF)-like protein